MLSTMNSFIGNENNCNEFVINDEWNSLAEYAIHGDNKKIILCGGKGVGKSTLLRYLVNKSLNKWPEVLVLDFDPGQSEFTVMGCLSVTLVENPLLGPNFLHLSTPTKCLYLGDISAANCSKLYVDCVKNITEFCNLSQSYSNIPWLVNTMGFTKDLGIKLLSDIIFLVQPTDVVQINSQKSNCNFPQSISPDFILQNRLSKPTLLNYKLHIISSVPEHNKSDFENWGLTSVSKRNIVTLSYFNPILKCKDYNFCNVIPYRVNMNRVKIIVNKSVSRDIHTILNMHQKLNCINGNLVALCITKVNNDIPDCKGFGIVRGFDLNAEEIFIITPLNKEQLEGITEIHMSSSIQLPDVAYKNQLLFAKKKVPYIAYKRAFNLNKSVRKTSARLKMYPIV